ncbi:hypothetical protein FHT76_004959 [Rhizobium sp. BK176]|nr:hypothetical protein [Rhizobium sp. BK399]MCS3741110.1 hypothetical protein [Rhizobium sp. BK661]MCS4093274.1 hypothetical protein [Rhizobium sp. BK176]
MPLLPQSTHLAPGVTASANDFRHVTLRRPRNGPTSASRTDKHERPTISFDLREDGSLGNAGKEPVNRCSWSEKTSARLGFSSVILYSFPHSNRRNVSHMAVRSLIVGTLFVAAFVALILSIAWIDKSQPIHQPAPLAPAPERPIPPPAE